MVSLMQPSWNWKTAQKWYSLVSDNHSSYLSQINMLELHEWLPINPIEKPKKAFKDKDWSQVYMHTWDSWMHYIREDGNYSQYFPNPLKRWVYDSMVKDKWSFFRLFIEDTDSPIFIDKESWIVLIENPSTATLWQKVKRWISNALDEMWSPMY